MEVDQCVRGWEGQSASRPVHTLPLCHTQRRRGSLRCLLFSYCDRLGTSPRAEETPGQVVLTRTTTVILSFTFESSVCHPYIHPSFQLHLQAPAITQTFPTENLLPVKSVWMVGVQLLPFSLLWPLCRLQTDRGTSLTSQASDDENKTQRRLILAWQVLVNSLVNELVDDKTYYTEYNWLWNSLDLLQMPLHDHKPTGLSVKRLASSVNIPFSFLRGGFFRGVTGAKSSNCGRWPGYTLYESPAHYRTLTDGSGCPTGCQLHIRSNFGVQYLAQGYFLSSSPREPGFEPATFQSLVHQLYPLSNISIYLSIYLL